MTYRMQTAPRNGKMAALIDEAVRHAIDAWARAADEAAQTIVAAYGAAGVTSSLTYAGGTPELRFSLGKNLAYRQWWEWKDGVGTLRMEWTEGWEGWR